MSERLYQPFPKQSLFHQSKAKYRLFGGAAGPGKTKALLWEAIRTAHRYDGCDTLLLRRTFPELESSLLAQFRRDVPKKLYKSYNDSKHIVTWKNGSVTRFGYCLRKKDVIQYQGSECVFVGFDELTHFLLYQWMYLGSRNRCSVPGSFSNMAGATNPGGPGHAWVKSLWIDIPKALAEGREPIFPPDFEKPELYDPMEWDYIPSLLDDNPIYANDRAYRKSLEMLPGQLREALLRGNWNIYAGQYFDNWDDEKHVIPAAELLIQPWWPKWGSFDWGYAHDAVFQWHCQAGTVEKNGKQYPLVITYREMARRGLSERALGEEIAAKNAGDKLGAIYAGHDIWRETSTGQTKEKIISDVLRAAGMPALTHAKIDRTDGWRACHRMMDESEWAVTDACPRLIAAIPQAIHDEDNLEDVLKTDQPDDNDRDAWRYGVYSPIAPKQKPLAIQIQEDTAHLTDRTNRNIQIQKILAGREAERRSFGTVQNHARYGRHARYSK